MSVVQFKSRVKFLHALFERNICLLEIEKGFFYYQEVVAQYVGMNTMHVKVC